MNGLPEDKVNELIDYALFLKSNMRRTLTAAAEGDLQGSEEKDQMRSKNLTLLSENKDYQTKEDEDYVTEKVIYGISSGTAA